MKLNCQFIYTSIIVISVVALTAICYHSIEEIHYLKSFFPQEFTVKEAFYASAVELIKIVIMGIPFLLVIALCAILLLKKNNGSQR